ncbi:hypothetical protein BDV59DRAFT_173529 [Aspergillus ambiguus]|uniref:uncharacterized protein n=1 Tax=Aspergillus ambiguus TaxID=176160 RepID=UPI003CCC91F8
MVRSASHPPFVSAPVTLLAVNGIRKGSREPGTEKGLSDPPNRSNPFDFLVEILRSKFRPALVELPLTVALCQ